MIQIDTFPEVSISDDILSKKYGDVFFWNNKISGNAKTIMKHINEKMEEYGALFVASQDGYTVMPQIYSSDDLEFVKRLIDKKPDKTYIISPPNTVYLTYKLVIYNNRIIDGCLFKPIVSRLLPDDLDYLETIVKEKFFPKWKPDYPLYCMTIYYLDGMKGFKLGAIEDIKQTELYKIDLNYVVDKINGKLNDVKGKKKK